MNPELFRRILYSRLINGHEVDITVTGISMEPTLYEGDVVTLRRAETYKAGDVLVFTYKHNELLIHRLLRAENGRYYCKGDNSFRLEDVEYEQIAGKVVLKNHEALLPFSQTAITLSYLVNRAFRKNGYSTVETKKSGIYRFYEHYLKKAEDLTMIYQKNEAMDYIAADDTSLVVFDPESGDTHLFDETGTDILNFLNEPCSLDDLLDNLCKIYEASPLDIRSDVEEFLADCIAKKVVMVK